jgi:ABC-type lipoprotein export system ATPase subunit
MDLLLTIRDLHKTYNLGTSKITVLRGINLSIKKGEFVAIRGASGAGKSTLLHLIGKLDIPDSGEIIFYNDNGNAQEINNLPEWRNRNVGFIFQAYYLLPELTAIENVMLPARLARVPSKVAADRARKLLEKVGLGERLHHRPRELSGGEQQRVAIARAIINNPKLVLADEPTGNLDSKTGDEIINLLSSIKN